MSDKTPTSAIQPPESNAQDIASRLVYQTVDLDGTGLINTLSLLLSRAAQQMRSQLETRGRRKSAGSRRSRFAAYHRPGRRRRV